MTNAHSGEGRGGYVLSFPEIDHTHVAIAGGKGAHLGELSRIDGIRVPAGFCVTTNAFRRATAEAPSIAARIERLSRLQPDDREAIRAETAEIRRVLEGIAVPADVTAVIERSLGYLGRHVACAVRSSATAEDLPASSFAGQHDTYLNVTGSAAILHHVRRCWASLFTERAVTYRLRSGVHHHKVHMAVIVQQMVVPQASGVLFTADPVTGHRKVVSVEATFGLGEPLVSGLVNADAYKIHGGNIVARAIARKQVALHPAPAGGTQPHAIAPERQEEPALTDAQVVRLAQLGRRIAAHFGRPQEAEWCLVDDDFHIVQSRAITTLFPIPEAGDRRNRVYLSVGHQQMMSDPLKPLGLSFWQMTTPRPMAEAGGRLFVDVTETLASPTSRAALLAMVGRTDPLTADALQTILGRGDFVELRPEDDPGARPLGASPAGTPPEPIASDPAIVDALIESTESSVAALKRDITTKAGPALFEFIAEDLQELKRLLFDPQSHQVIMAGMEAAWWLNEHMRAWLGEKNAADTLAQGAPHNVTSAMGLALLDVADAIRPHPEVVDFLTRVVDDRFLDELPTVNGGRAARDAIRAWLERYGMRGVGEIDITRPRWSERPSSLLPLILAHVRNFEPGEGKRRLDQGRLAARQKEHALLERLRSLPDGERKAGEARRMIDRLRAFIGYREFPKYGMVCRYFVYKQALLEEAARLVRSDVLRDNEDIFYLSFEEFRELVRTRQLNAGLLRERKDAFRAYRSLMPPRVLTSDGETVAGARARDDLPAGALVGLATSAGIAEGRARIVLDAAEANLERGDILVTTYTDPSWTPLFVTIAGVVTEVGGLMSHGAVIAREYGVPAVVGVERATMRIRDGQRIRVHGTDGYVEVLS